MKTAALLSLLLMFSTAALVQDTGLTAKINQLQIGKSTLEDVVRIFGEPLKLHRGVQTFTRADLPARYIASYTGFALSIVDRAVREVYIETPAYAGVGGVRVGFTTAEAIRAVGEPKAIAKGAPPGDERQPGVLYEGTAETPGRYARPDLGLAMFLRQGKVSALILTPQRGGKLKELPRIDANSRDPFQLDLRGADLSELDLRSRAEDLLAAALFDSRTVWPPRDRMPEGFDPQRLMEIGKNPGLGVRSLHRRGITGRGVAIALVDNRLPESHQEYAARLRRNEQIGIAAEPHFHGSVTLSIAAGETVGVAPGTDLYFVSCRPATGNGPDMTAPAKAFDRILEINRALPPGRKIRVISMSAGWMPHHRGAAEMDAAAARAKAEGLLVITSNIEQTHGFRFFGLGRAPLADPDAFDSYQPAALLARVFEAAGGSTDSLLVPMDSRTGADGPGAYIYFRQGGWSWAMPYIAGLYALAAQVDPSITPDRFWELALKTGRTVRIERSGTSYPLGPIVDPVALIAALKNP